jgi:hypothetical protein
VCLHGAAFSGRSCRSDFGPQDTLYRSASGGRPLKSRLYLSIASLITFFFHLLSFFHLYLWNLPDQATVVIFFFRLACDLLRAGDRVLVVARNSERYTIVYLQVIFPFPPICCSGGICIYGSADMYDRLHRKFPSDIDSSSIVVQYEICHGNFDFHAVLLAAFSQPPSQPETLGCSDI